MKSERKNSALKRLIPAAAMLATSAVMLSTATYAWFTMNKEVQMTGLKMTATTGEGIEIALASVRGDNKAITWSGDTYDTTAGYSHPKDVKEELGWKNAVIVGDYYSDIGKLKPVSSVTGVNLFSATNASERGKEATEFEVISTNDNTNMSEYTHQANIPDSESPITSEKKAGYYFDIPVHIRTAKTHTDEDPNGEIYCKIKINPADKPDTVAEEDYELYKAIRIQFLKYDKSAGNDTIYGVDGEYYTDSLSYKGAVSAVTNKVGTKTVPDIETLTNTGKCVSVGNNFATGNGASTGLVLPYAEGEAKYGHLDFYVRVWLEGESTFCHDDNSGQSWNIDFAFALDGFETPTTP